MNIGPSFKADTQSPILMEPSKRSFNHPSVNAKTAAMLSAWKCQNSLYASIAQPLYILRRSIRSIALYFQRTFAGTAMRQLNRRNLIDHRQKLRRVVSLCSSERKPQGHAVGVGYNMMFASRFSSIYGGRTTFFPPRQPTAQMQNRQSLATNRFYRHCPVCLKAPCAAFARHDVFANRATVASNSCHYRSPFLAVACSMEFQK
jgi:hypothetical protein